MSIHIGSCSRQETIVVATRSSVYELVVLQGELGDVLVRGGSYFKAFRRVLLLGSTAPGGFLKSRTIEIGSCMKFLVDGRLLVTSPVRSLSRHSASAASGACAAAG